MNIPVESLQPGDQIDMSSWWKWPHVSQALADAAQYELFTVESIKPSANRVQTTVYLENAPSNAIVDNGHLFNVQR